MKDGRMRFRFEARDLEVMVAETVEDLPLMSPRVGRLLWELLEKMGWHAPQVLAFAACEIDDELADDEEEAAFLAAAATYAKAIGERMSR